MFDISICKNGEGYGYRDGFDAAVSIFSKLRVLVQEQIVTAD
jgi:hypothetical protein